MKTIGTEDIVARARRSTRCLPSYNRNLWTKLCLISCVKNSSAVSAGWRISLSKSNHSLEKPLCRRHLRRSGFNRRDEGNYTTYITLWKDRFPLQKWSSNFSEVLPKNIDKSSSPVEIEPALCKILGLVWKPDTDIFHFSAISAITSL